MYRWFHLHYAVLVVVFGRALGQEIPSCKNNTCCQNSSYTELDNSRRSINSQWKSGQIPLCDRDHVTVSGWYRFTSFVGGKMPTSKVDMNHCGTHYPIWLHDAERKHPTNVTGPVAKIKACINILELAGGCFRHFTVGVKLCPGNFYVYYLQKITGCHTAYCAGHGQLCPYGQTRTSSSPCRPIPRKFPSWYLGYPNISVKAEYAKQEPVPLFCIVPIHEEVRQWKNVTYEIEWYTDGRSTFTEKPICKPANGQNESSSSCPGVKDIHSVLYYYAAGQRISCKVKAKFTNNPEHHWSDAVTTQQPFFAGIKVTPTTLLIRECDGKFFHNITLTPTIPVGKNVLTVTFYLPNGLWLKSKNKKCSVQLEGTKSVTVEVGAQCTTLYGFEKLVVITPKITHAVDGIFWGAFGLPTIWVTVLQKDQPLRKCRSITDPHISPLRKISAPDTWRDFFGHDEYLLYKNKERNFEVQTKQWGCNREGITCNCGVIIRDHNDLINFSCCGNPPKLHRDNFTPISVDIPRKKCLAPGIAITQLIKGFNSKYEVIVPTGIIVIVERNRWGIDVTIYTPRTQVSQNEAGLCTYSGDRGDITHLASNYRLNASTSYFQTLPDDINKKAIPQFETSCPCNEEWPQNIEDHEKTCAIGGIPVRGLTGGLTATGYNRIKMCDNNPQQSRKKRAVEGSDELTQEDLAVLMMPFKSNEHHREKRSVVSKENATRYCAERLLETKVGKLCAKLGTNVQALVNVCSADIQYTGDFSFAIGAVSVLMNDCQDVIIENITVNTNETSNLTKPTMPPALEEVFQLLCPNDCTFNGKCVNGSCVCNKDYTANDCSISVYQRPTITRIQSNGLCDRRKRPCEKTTVQGIEFLNSTNMTCHIREIEIVNSSWIPNRNEAKYQGTMTDLVLVECLLPYLPVLRMRYDESIEGTPAAGLMISVSNNGIDKSSQELKMISFDSVCMDCNVSTGCTLKKNTCFINRYCFAPNEPNPRDWCQQCIPEVNSNSWTKRQVNHPPNVTMETNYYAVYRENFRLPIEAVDPEGMPVTVSLEGGSPKKAVIQNNVLYWNVTTSQTTQFFFKATDACQASSTFNMSVMVVPCPCNNSGQCVPQGPRGQGNYKCQCAPGYTGEYCSAEIDECASYPCLRGRCTDLLNNYSCSCYLGFEGRNCDIDIDYCKSSPCVNAGNCTDEVSGYTCNCLPGYSGFQCEVDINECSSSPCLNYGTCIDQVNSFECHCLAGYTGHNCGVNVDECQSSPCVNGGSCTDRINGFECACKAGFSGLRCKEDINECLQVSCGNGTCLDGINNFSCLCNVGYTGTHCDVLITKCSNDSCYPGVSCLDKTLPISCGPCPSGFTGNGKNCQDIDDCVNHSCTNGATCVDGINNYSCNCKAGFTGAHCETDLDDCVNHNCSNGASCIDGINSYSCNCSVGFTGLNCETDIDDCVHHTCTNGASCIDGINGYSCNCSGGFSGEHCENNLDDCVNHNCSNGASCIDGINSYSCNCSVGFTGLNCETDIDDCVSDTCANGASCMDGINTYSCKCTAGFTGWNCETDLDDCVNHNCSNGASCIDGINSYSCNCSAGFTGLKCEADIDDCVSHTCANGASCVDGVNTYSCKCTAGFTGWNCVTDIDDCMSHVCANGGSCKDGIGDYTCKCTVGFTGKYCKAEITVTTTPNVAEYSYQIKLMETWNDELNDKNSDAFKDLKNVLEEEIMNKLRKTTNIIGVNVVSFSKGSIVAEFKLIHHMNDEPKEAFEMLKEKINNGYLGTLRVDRSSLVRIPSTTTEPTTKPSEKLPYAIIIAVSFGGLFVLVLCIICLARFCKNRNAAPRGKRGSDNMPPEEAFPDSQKYELKSVAVNNAYVAVGELSGFSCDKQTTGFSNEGFH